MRRLLWWLGVLNGAALLVHAALSWLEAGAAGYRARPYGQVAFYTRVGERVASAAATHAPDLLLLVAGAPAPARAVGLAPDREDALRRAEARVRAAIGGDWIQPHQFIDVYALPLLASTLFALGALLVLARARAPAGDGVPRLVRNWAIAFVLVMACAAPVLVPDFWLSFAWGRTLWWGGNPYYDVPAAAVEGLPFDAPILRMTYGPLWAILAWVVTALTGGSVLAGAIAWKAILVATWIGILALVRRLTSEQPAREQAMALVVVGWLPLGAVQVGGDGHNDALMILCILGWLHQLERGNRRRATLLLALSVVVKYVSAPLLLLDLLAVPPPGAERPSVLQRARAWLPSGLVVLGVWAVAFAPFLRSPDFFRETAAVREGFFYLPSDGVKAIGTLLGVDLLPVAMAVMAVFPAVTLACLWAWWRRPSVTSFRIAAAGVMLSVLFVAAGHVWPWYVLWLAVPAAVLPDASRIRRWSTGVLVGAPFPLAIWAAYPAGSEFRRFELPSLAVYGFALAWMLAGWRLVRPAPDATTA